MDASQIKQLRAKLGLTQQEFANKIGVSLKTITNYENGGAIPAGKQALLQSISREAEKNVLQHSEGNLIVGVGRVGDVNMNYRTNNLQQKDETSGNNSEILKGIPLIPISVATGFAGYDNCEVGYEDCERYFIPDFEKIGAEFLIRINGESMHPQYNEGDILACKKINDILFFQYGRVYVIDSSQGQLVKRIYEDPKKPDYVLLVSDNKEKYPPFPIPKSDIRSLSLVLGSIGIRIE